MDSGDTDTRDRSRPPHGRRHTRRHDRARLLLLLLVSGPLLAGGLTVRDARIAWVPGQLPNPGFFELVNDTNTTVTLTGARSPHFAHVRFKAAPDSDIFMLDPLDMPQAIGPAETLAFHPDGPYLFLYVKSRPMEPGDTATIELLFADRAPLSVEFTVRK